MNKALIKYVLTAARRDKLFLSLVCLMIAGSFVSFFLASSAVVDQAQYSIVYLGGSLRIVGLLGLVLFVVFFIRRSFDARDVEYLLTRPVSRSAFILSLSFGFSLLAFLISGAMSAGLTFLASGIGNMDGAIYWSTGVICEYVLMVNVALFFSMVLSSPVSASLSTFGFYVLSRIMGQLLFIDKNPPMLEIPGYSILSWIFRVISMIFPRLDLMTQTSWLLYGRGDLQQYIFIPIQALIFLVLVLLATLIDLRRKQF